MPLQRHAKLAGGAAAQRRSASWVLNTGFDTLFGNKCRSLMFITGLCPWQWPLRTLSTDVIHHTLGSGVTSVSATELTQVANI